MAAKKKYLHIHVNSQKIIEYDKVTLKSNFNSTNENHLTRKPNACANKQSTNKLNYKHERSNL